MSCETVRKIAKFRLFYTKIAVYLISIRAIEVVDMVDYQALKFIFKLNDDESLN